ncbi:glycosyltransferase family 4 protein [Halorubrum sp. ASP1]|uniref:glycosyltransferase family 4 protein n=1 Tax=Halorubrum sp. ASP1 TaxID=2518114 RepID=UPI00130530DD|nr:glycosyltransferase family 4 protein [Halorubrum sp. ASP1]
MTAHRPSKTAGPVETVSGSDAIILDNSSNFLIKYVFFVKKLFTKFYQSDYDVIVVNGMNLIGLISVLVGQITSTPVIVRIGGNIWLRSRERMNQYWNERSPLRLMKYILRFVISRVVQSTVAGFITVSGDLRQKTIKNTNISDSCVKVVRTPVQQDLYASEYLSGSLPCIEANKTFLLTVSNFKFPAKYEGVVKILDDVVPLLKEREDLVYVIAGGGRYLPALEQYVEKINTDNIRLLGYVENIKEIYACGDIFVYVSYNDGYPNVMLEAAAAGLPRIANTACGLPEQVEDGVDGILVDSDWEEGALREVVESLVNDPERASKMGGSAKKRVLTNNNKQKIGRDFHNTVEEILENC